MIILAIRPPEITKHPEQYMRCVRRGLVALMIFSNHKKFKAAGFPAAFV
jgi:hypothetical protein